MHPRLCRLLLLGLLLWSARISAVTAKPDSNKESTESKVRRLLREAREEAKRPTAIRELGTLGPAARSAVPVLMTALKDKSPRVRLEAAFALLKIDQTRGKEALETITALLEDQGQADLHLLVVVYMNNIRPASKETVAGCLALARHNHPLAPVAAWIALDNLGPQAKEAAGLLEEALKDDRIGIRIRAALGLARINPKYHAQAISVLQPALKDKDADIRKQAAEALVEIDRRQIPRVVAALAPDLKDSRKEVRLQTALYLLELDPTQTNETLPILVAGLKDKDTRHHVRAIKILAGLGTAGAVAEADLRALFKSDNSPVAAAAIEAIMRLHPDQGRPLFPTLVEQRDLKMQSGIADILHLIAVLHKIEETEIETTQRLNPDKGRELSLLQVKSLTEQLRKPFQRPGADLIRLDAVLRLAALGSRAKDAVPDLLKATADESPLVRSQAVYALGQISPDANKVVPRLVELYKDGKGTPADLRQTAGRVLQKISPEAAREAGVP